MTAIAPSENDLADAIEAATRQAVRDLFQERAGDHFYYLSLITTEMGHAPALAAWSYESLDEQTRKAADKKKALYYYKWSYADSPFYCYGEQHFAEVNRLFEARPQPDIWDSSQFDEEVRSRVAAMEVALARLDAEGLFGSGATRDGIVINVEIVPAHPSNDVRARRLNPPKAFRMWLAEWAEPRPW